MKEALDTAIARLLWVTPGAYAPPPSAPRCATRAFNASLLLSGTRCIVQYVLLPFVLPILGVAVGLSLWLSLLIDLVALTTLVVSLRRLWRTRAPGRGRYLPLALAMALAITVFLWYDVRLLVAAPT